MNSIYNDDLRLGIPFSADAAEQVKLAEKVKIAKLLNTRSDLRGKPTFAFSTAADANSDCAFSIERTYDGFILGVHIADVDEFVCKDSPLDDEAKARFRSLATADGKKYPMLPDELLQDVCLLAPNQDRLAVSLFLEITNSGEMVDIDIQKSVVRVTQKCVYGEVDALYTSSDRSVVLALKQKYANARDALDEMYELGGILYAKRMEDGSRQLFTYPTKCIRGVGGGITYFGRQQDADSRALITEFRIFAGVRVGEFLRKIGFPCIYSCRKPVSKQNLKYLYSLADIGFDDALSEAELQNRLSAEITEREESEFLGAEMFSALEPMYYSDEPEYNSFYGLYGTVYLTRPANRYCDLMILRLLKAYTDAEFNSANLNTPHVKRGVKYDVELFNAKQDGITHIKSSVISEIQREILHSKNIFSAKYIGDGMIVLPWGLIAECRFEGEPPRKFSDITVRTDDAEKPTFCFT